MGAGPAGRAGQRAGRIAAGLGADLSALGPGHRIVAFDYRGLYRSGPPPTRDAVTISDHAADLLAVLHRFAPEPALVVAWSMGVQVAVEAALAEPELFSGLVLVAGAPGDPLAGVLHLPVSRFLVPPVTRLVEAGAAPFGAALRRAADSGRMPGLLRRTGVVAPSCDLGTFQDMAADFAGLDWRVYMRTIRAMARHDAWPRVGEVAVPALVVGGTRDLFLPADTVRALAVSLPAAELLLIEGATHYLPLEFPELLAERTLVFERARDLRAGIQ